MMLLIEGCTQECTLLLHTHPHPSLSLARWFFFFFFFAQLKANFGPQENLNILLYIVPEERKRQKDTSLNSYSLHVF